MSRFSGIGPEVFRVRHETKGGHVFHEGPYATKAAAKARVTHAQRYDSYSVASSTVEVLRGEWAPTEEAAK